MALRLILLSLALLVGSVQSNLKGASLRRTNALAEAYAKQKAGGKLPWPMLDADGGEEYEFANQEDTESDPKTFSLSQYEHTDARDDADVAEDEDYEDPELNDGETDGPEDDSKDENDMESDD